jgi:hypothetical protein
MRIGRLFAGGCRAELEDLRESECQELHIGRVTMNLPEFATNYMIQGHVRPTPSFSGIVTRSYGLSAGLRLR